jgi:hypothetical protein
MDSPVLVNIFAKVIRRTRDAGHAGLAVTVSEMFPSHDQLWLRDAEGHSYTSELRMVTLDISGANQEGG